MVRDCAASRAFAAAFVATGVELVTAFPGSPTTALALYLEAHGQALGIEFRWSINENVALSQAFGAAMAGRGAAALVKHVGVNVAADALQVMGVVHGLAAPLLLIEGADAKPGSSQSAQDNRSLYAGSPQLLVVAPSSPAEIARLVVDAASIARAAGMLVVVRGDARCFQSEGEVPELPELARASPYAAWPERGWALATSARTYALHLELRRATLTRLRPWIDAQAHGFGLERGGAEVPLALVIAGHLGIPTAEAAHTRGLAGVRLTVEHPLPETPLLELAARAHELVVLEECTPTLEQQVRALVQRAGLATKILGRSELGDTRPIGRLEGDALEAVLDQVERRRSSSDRHSSPRPLPDRTQSPDPQALLAEFGPEVEAAYATLDAAKPPPGFPPSDPRQALFPFLRTLAPRTFIAADPGITGVLALAKHGCDVKMHMGGAVAIAAGFSRTHPGGLAIAVVGDTNLPHSEWLGILDAIHHGDDVLIVVADNGSSEMTQDIVTPRLSPEAARASLAAAGLACCTASGTTSVDDPWTGVLREAAKRSGPRLVWLLLR
jgi:indolepyruvate ferredoxin oxidoreductase, alpha subunit